MEVEKLIRWCRHQTTGKIVDEVHYIKLRLVKTLILLDIIGQYTNPVFLESSSSVISNDDANLVFQEQNTLRDSSSIIMNVNFVLIFRSANHIPAWFLCVPGSKEMVGAVLQAAMARYYCYLSQGPGGRGSW